MKALSPNATYKQCARWILDELVRKDRMFHLEDDAADIQYSDGRSLFTDAEANVANNARRVLYDVMDRPGRCPIAWMMRLERCEARRLGKESVFA